MLDHLTVVSHPLVQHKLTLMREKDTSTASFRKLLREISLLLAYEVTRELPMTTKRIETPLEEMDAPVIEGKKLALISILRAGNGLLDGILELIPAARVGFVGLYRDPETLQPVQYYCKLPEQMEDRIAIVVRDGRGATTGVDQRDELFGQIRRDESLALEQHRLGGRHALNTGLRCDFGGDGIGEGCHGRPKIDAGCGLAMIHRGA